MRTVVANLKLSAEAVQHKAGANLEILDRVEQAGNELRQVKADELDSLPVTHFKPAM